MMDRTTKLIHSSESNKKSFLMAGLIIAKIYLTGRWMICTEMIIIFISSSSSSRITFRILLAILKTWIIIRWYLTSHLMAIIIMVFLMIFPETKLLNKIDKSSKTSSSIELHNNSICIDIKLSFAPRIRKSMTGLVVFLLIACRILEGSLIDFNIIHSLVQIKI